MPKPDGVPGWLIDEMFNGLTERWMNQQSISLPTFLEKYNLHDSTWYGIWLMPGFHALAILRWDTQHPISLYPDFFPPDIWQHEPILMFRLNILPYQIMTVTSGWEVSFRPIIKKAYSKVISSEERANMLDIATTDKKLKEFVVEPELHHTIFESLFKDEIHLIHHPDVKILCVDMMGNTLKVPL